MWSYLLKVTCTAFSWLQNRQSNVLYSLPAVCLGGGFFELFRLPIVPNRRYVTRLS